jgi:hypothetical protein
MDGSLRPNSYEIDESWNEHPVLHLATHVIFVCRHVHLPVSHLSNGILAQLQRADPTLQLDSTPLYALLVRLKYLTWIHIEIGRWPFSSGKVPFRRIALRSERNQVVVPDGARVSATALL